MSIVESFAFIYFNCFKHVLFNTNLNNCSGKIYRGCFKKSYDSQICSENVRLHPELVNRILLKSWSSKKPAIMFSFGVRTAVKTTSEEYDSHGFQGIFYQKQSWCSLSGEKD